jgi:hypothetical protein
MAVIAAAGTMGICSDELCAQAVGGLMSDRYWSWADAQHAQGAADESDNALNILVGRPMAQVKSPDAEVGNGVTLQLPSQASN